jgi:subtilisin family serine protease
MRRKLSVALCAAALAAAACRDGSTPSEPPTFDPQLAQDGDLVPGQYVVVFNDDVSDVATEAMQRIQAHQGALRHLYTNALKGFSANLSPAAVDALRRDPSIRLIEQDRVVRIGATQSPTPSWGLDRIDQRNLPLNNSYTYPVDGTGVTLYGIDTGIFFGHTDFGGRAVSGFDAIDGGTADDCNGHGTHTASTAGGATYGVAKNMSIIAVRVLNCGGSGTFEQVIAGVDWVTGDHQAGEPAVANMSLGGSVFTSLDMAVANSVADGVVYSISAGNSSADACFTTPAREPSALTVGATGGTFGSSDARAFFSNFGTCLDIFAPGVQITAAWIGSPTAINTIDGTSMAAPHVAGVAGLYLDANPGSTPAQVMNAITTNATPGVVTNPGTGSPNLLLYMGFIEGGDPNNEAPVASWTYSCNASLLCTFDGSGSTDSDGTIVSWTWRGPGGQTIGSGEIFQRQFQNTGQGNITLDVTDDDGAVGSLTQLITVAPPGGGDTTPPVASFTWSCDAARLCSFDGTGSTDNVGVVSWTWTLPNGATFATGPTATRQFTRSGSGNITLTVADAAGNTNAQVQTIVIP